MTQSDFDQLSDKRFLGPINDQGLFTNIERANEVLHKKKVKLFFIYAV